MILLLYHRVTELATDPQLLAVSPKHFAEHLDVLRRVALPMKIADLVARADRGASDPGVAITFDDGYADNLLEAAPLLRRFDTPATVFVASGNLGSAREFFWDELDRIFLQPGVLPAELMVESQRFNLNAGAEYLPGGWELHRSWDVTRTDVPTARQRVYRDVCGLIHQMPTALRESTLRQIRGWAGVAEIGRPSHRVMTRDEVRMLAADGLVEVAAHTVTHPLLAIESDEHQRTEIGGSKATLEETLDRSVSGFSYPFGTRRSYSAATVEAVRAAGFSYACSNFTGPITSASNPFELPRFVVRDWDGDEFELRLRGWLAA